MRVSLEANVTEILREAGPNVRRFAFIHMRLN